MIAGTDHLARMRLGVRPFERPYRMARALASMAPYGMGMVGAIAGACARYPHADAMITPSGRMTFRQLWMASTALGIALQRRKIGPGDRIGLLARNDHLFVIAMLAGARVGADVVLLNTAIAGPQLADVVAAEGVNLILHDTDLTE